jgi:hypothetical protein
MADFEKDSNEVVTYTWDWGPDCNLQGTTVSSAAWTVPTGITQDTSGTTTTTATTTMSGGTPGREYPITCLVTFANSEKLSHTKTIRVREH